MKTKSTIPVTRKTQAFLSVKLFTHEAVTALSKKDVKKYFQTRIMHEGFKNFKIEVLQYKFLLFYVNFQRAEVTFLFSNTSYTALKRLSINFFVIQPAKELFGKIQKGLFKELNIKVEKSNAQSRNPEFRNVIKKQPQNQFRNRSDPMHPSNKDRKPSIIKKFVTKKQ